MDRIEQTQGEHQEYAAQFTEGAAMVNGVVPLGRGEVLVDRDALGESLTTERMPDGASFAHRHAGRLGGDGRAALGSPRLDVHPRAEGQAHAAAAVPARDDCGGNVRMGSAP